MTGAALDQLFRSGVAAIDAGDVAELERLLTAHPSLVRDRLDEPGAWLRDKVGGALDGFFQKPYLLWFVAEDPVRTGKLPTNIAEVTRAIIAPPRARACRPCGNSSTTRFDWCRGHGSRGTAMCNSISSTL